MFFPELNYRDSFKIWVSGNPWIIIGLNAKLSFMKVLVFRVLLFAISLTFTAVSCKTIQGGQQSDQRPSIVTFPDSIQASQFIISEDESAFFGELRPLELEIQMKISDDRVTLDTFKQFLQTQVSDWTIDEKIQLYELVEDVKRLCDTLSPRLFPSGLKLIKIKTEHYGPDVFYTKGQSIFVPENIFRKFNGDRFFPILVHELFHIISRYHPEWRHELYALIGFRPSEKPVELNDFLSMRKLSNPDALSHHYYIVLENECVQYKVIPLIFSKYDGYSPQHPSFFDYLSFDMFELMEPEGKYLAVTNERGATTIPSEAMDSFFAQIKDNTRYIIHPEEIMADNFMLALLAYSSGDYKKFSKEGKDLIDRVTAILKKI